MRTRGQTGRLPGVMSGDRSGGIMDRLSADVGFFRKVGTSGPLFANQQADTPRPVCYDSEIRTPVMGRPCRPIPHRTRVWERFVTALTSWADQLLHFCDQAVTGGYLVAMVLICALQYLYQLYRGHRASELKQELCRQIDDVRKDLRSVSRDRTLTSLENQILRDFAGELDLDRTLDQLIRRLVEETKDGFAAYVPVGALQGDVTLARGLSDQSREFLLVDAPLLERVRKEGVTVLPKVDIYGSRLYENLSAADRARFDRLFLAAVGNGDDLAGVIVTTTLIPSGIPLDEQIELVRRLLRSLGGIVKRTEELELRDRELQSMKEIMELRRHRSETPLTAGYDRGLCRPPARNGPGRSGGLVPGQYRRKTSVQAPLPLRHRPIGGHRQKACGHGNDPGRNRPGPHGARVLGQCQTATDRH